MQTYLEDQNGYLPFYFKANILSSSFIHSTISIITFNFLSFSLISKIFLFLISSSFDVWFLNRLILWCTHSVDILELVPVNQIHHLLLHIFHRIIWVSMKVNSFFLWPVYNFIGALRLVTRSVFLIFLIYSAIFSIYLELITLPAIKSKWN